MTKILIVDDSATMRKIVISAIRRAGFEVETFVEASNGVEGLKALAIDPAFDLVVSDVDMPQMDGVAFVRAARKRHTKEDLPIVMTSTRSEHTTLSSAIESGANAFVTKPLEPDRVREVIGRYVD